MTSEPIKVLLVEDNPENIRLIREMFKLAGGGGAAGEGRNRRGVIGPRAPGQPGH
jgi:CheY-like chemotaxis protein